MKNDHRSEFSNLSNWKEEAWKKPQFKYELFHIPWHQYIFFFYWFPPHYYLGGVVTRILYYCAAIIWFEGSGDEIVVTQSLRDVRA